ncbi:MAG: tRNA-specific adenosine deaminase [Flavobacteriales bacterium]|jgi:tRNA(adenine34) deaminase|nr:tRNA-specific adenosine deaminase [Flavobacteriales bacterium]|tara:strand:+ start:2623 stop:3078 length:456 start_codon:yes stop_codon:yes gene_type:complete
MINTDEMYMKKALLEAKIAMDKDEVPVGAIIVHNNKIIAKAHNLTIHLCDPTAHAEMQAITAACNYLQSRYLDQCTLYTTLEPCIMCGSALSWSKIGKVVYGASDQKRGISYLEKNILHKKTIIKKNILMYECGNLLSEFFKKKRKLKQKN